MNVMPPRARRTRALLAAYDGSALPRLTSWTPRVAVIGAGLAGLAAGHVLKQAGLAPAVFEAAPRVGGRARTDHGLQEPGLITEHGGEFIALGSYTCYRPGQWTTIAGDEAGAVGNLYFAGEHCATVSQGYMNGAAETGRQAALQILQRLTGATKT